MRVYIYSLFFLLLINQPVYAAFELKNCIAILQTSATNLKNLESKLPKPSEQANSYFSRWYKSMGLPSFYSLKNRPQYYLWLLHHDLGKAKSALDSHIDRDESFDAHARTVFLGVEFSTFSNLRNSWTEYAAYSGDSSLSDSEKDKISADMMGLMASTSVYFGCLMANLQESE